MDGSLEWPAVPIPPTSPPAADGLPPDRPIMVVGCPRSGTTLLQLMLHAHPRIAIPPETRHLLETHRRRTKFGDLRKQRNRQKVADYITKRPKFKDLGVDRDLVRARIVDGPATVGSALGIVLQEYARRFDKPRWGDKRPLYLNHLPVIFELFPDAQVIHIVRDGRACVASLKRMPWWQGGSVTAMSRWVQSMRMGQKARSSLRPDQYLEIQYEQLVAQPRAELERLCAFLGEDFDEAMLAPQHLADQAVPQHKNWHERTRGEVSTAPVNAWESQLERWEIATFEVVARKWMRQYGYTPVARAWHAPPLRLLEAAAHVVRRERTVAALRREDQQRARDYNQPVAAQLTREQLRLAAQRDELRIPDTAQ